MGPDFPTGGTIFRFEKQRNILTGEWETVDAIRQMYAHGRGRVVMRAQVAFEEVRGDRTAIIVTELPYQVNKASLLEKMAELVKDKRIDGIADLRDESDRDGMRIYIEIKRDANPHKVLNNLFKHTPMQLAFNMNMLALVDGQPQTLPLRSGPRALRRPPPRDRPAPHRVRPRQGARPGAHPRGPQDRPRQPRRGHQDDPRVARGRGRPQQPDERFDLSELQAQAILDMRLARLAALERQKIEDEYLAVIQLIAELEDILANPARVLQIIKDELAELKSKYAGDRRTRVQDDSSREMTDEDLIADEDVVVTISSRGYIKRQPVDTYRRQHRGGKGIIGHVTREEDAVEHLLVANTHDWALFFTNRGRVFSAKVHAIPDASRQAKGMAIINLPGVQVESGEVPMPTIVLPDFEPGNYPRPRDPQGHHQEDPARAVRARPLDRHPGDHDRRRRRARLGRRLERRRRRHHRHRAGHARPVRGGRGPGDGPRRGRRHRHPPAQARGRQVVAMSVVEAGRRPARPDRDRLRQARPDRRVPAQAPRRPGRPAHRPRGPQDRDRRRRPAGHRGGRGARPHLRGRPGHPHRDEHDQPLLLVGARRDRHAPGRGRPASPRSPPSGPDLRTAPNMGDDGAPADGRSRSGRTGQPGRDAWQRVTTIDRDLDG